MLTKVKKVIQAIEDLSGTEQQAFLEKLPNVLKPSVGKRPLTDAELAQLGRLSRSYRRKWAQGKMKRFRSSKTAARHLTSLQTRHRHSFPFAPALMG